VCVCVCVCCAPGLAHLREVGGRRWRAQCHIGGVPLLAAPGGGAVGAPRYVRMLVGRIGGCRAASAHRCTHFAPFLPSPTRRTGWVTPVSPLLSGLICHNEHARPPGPLGVPCGATRRGEVVGHRPVLAMVISLSLSLCRCPLCMSAAQHRFMVTRHTRSTPLSSR
jgi:hypothetical protein